MRLLANFPNPAGNQSPGYVTAASDALRVGFFAGGNPHSVKRAWMPAFAGMTEKRLAGSAVIPAQAGIQKIRGMMRCCRKTYSCEFSQFEPVSSL